MLCFLVCYDILVKVSAFGGTDLERENVLIPQADLDRQREFEEKIRGLFAAREAHPAACVDTFGCQQNVADG